MHELRRAALRLDVLEGACRRESAVSGGALGAAEDNGAVNWFPLRFMGSWFSFLLRRAEIHNVKRYFAAVPCGINRVHGEPAVAAIRD